MKRLLLCLSVILLILAGCTDRLQDTVKDGDIIFQTSKSAQSTAIQKATHSEYSHMGIIFIRDKEPYVYEAIKTVRYTPLDKWIARGEGGHYVVKRLRNVETMLTAEKIPKLHRAAKEFEGKPYDLTFEWSDDRAYCSELVWKIYDRGLDIQIGDLEKLRDFDLSEPVVKATMKERYGDSIPLDETVISPAQMFSCGLLQVVAEH